MDIKVDLYLNGWLEFGVSQPPDGFIGLFKFVLHPRMSRKKIAPADVNRNKMKETSFFRSLTFRIRWGDFVN